MTILFKKRRFKRPKDCAKVYMSKFNNAKKGIKNNKLF